MAKFKVTGSKKFDDMDGVWRTIRGRHVFIKKGQSLREAMEESGKFSKKEEQGNQERPVAKKLSKQQGKKHLPRNMSKDIYELDVDKGNAWSGNAPTKNANGEEVMIAFRNGPSENSAEDIVKAMQEKYPQLDAQISDRGNEIMFKLKKEETAEDNSKKKLFKWQESYEKNQQMQQIKRGLVDNYETMDEDSRRTVLSEYYNEKETKFLLDDITRDYNQKKSNEKSDQEVTDWLRETKGEKEAKKYMNMVARNEDDTFKKATANDKYANLYGELSSYTDIYGEDHKLNWLPEKDANRMLDAFNDEGSDFTFGYGTYDKENKKLKTTVGVFSPTDEGYVERDLEIPYDPTQDTPASFRAKIRDWQREHSSWDSFYNEDFNNKSNYSWENNKTLDKLTETTKDMSDYDKYNLAVSKLEQGGLNSDEKHFWNKTKMDYERTRGYENEDRSYAGWELYSDDPNRYKKSSSKKVAENDIEEKGYEYYSTHGVGPGTVPKDVTVRGGNEKNGYTSFKTDRPLTDDELKKYDIKSETLNSKIEAKADRPVAKKLASQQQGKSTRKEVKNKIQQHILEHFTKDYGYEGDQEDAFVSQMDYMRERNENTWQTGKRFAEGGSLLVYTEDMRNFLDDLKINPKGKKFSDEKVFQTYTNLIGREAEDLYNTIQKRKTMNESQLIKSYINRGYSTATAKKMAKLQLKKRK